MTSLRELQIAIRNHALDQGGTGIATAAISDTHPIEPRLRLNIHRNATLLGLSEALSSLFPVVFQLVGEGFFNHTCKAYLKSHTCNDPVLYRLGNKFPEFLDTFHDAADLPYLPDVARLEVAWTEAYHAKDTHPIPPEILQKFPEEQLGDILLAPIPSVRFVTSNYPIGKIWTANLPGAEPSETISLDDGGETVMVYRPDTRVIVRPISNGAHAFLKALSSKQNIAQAMSTALASDPSFSIVDELRNLLLAQCFGEAKLP